MNVRLSRSAASARSSSCVSGSDGIGRGGCCAAAAPRRQHEPADGQHAQRHAFHVHEFRIRTDDVFVRGVTERVQNRADAARAGRRLAGGMSMTPGGELLLEDHARRAGRRGREDGAEKAPEHQRRRPSRRSGTRVSAGRGGCTRSSMSRSSGGIDPAMSMTRCASIALHRRRRSDRVGIETTTVTNAPTRPASRPTSAPSPGVDRRRLVLLEQVGGDRRRR